MASGSQPPACPRPQAQVGRAIRRQPVLDRRPHQFIVPVLCAMMSPAVTLMPRSTTALWR